MNQISAEEIKKAADNKKDFILLDVRTTGEYMRGKIAGSINIPVDEVAEKVISAIPDKTKTVYVYCLSGSRSVPAAEILISLGYKNVFNMTNGLLAWRGKSYPTV